MAQAPSVPTVSGTVCTFMLSGGVSLTASASGAEPLTFQWFNEGRVLEVETNGTLVRTSITHLDFGFYNVVVSNAYGSAKSAGRYVGNCLQFWYDWDFPAPGEIAAKPNWKSVKYLNGHFIVGPRAIPAPPNISSAWPTASTQPLAVTVSWP